MSILVVTTFSKEGYECYGRRFVDSFLQHAPHAPLVCYHESMDVDRIGDNLEWRNLDLDMDRRVFIAKNSVIPERLGDDRHPNWQSIRFCHKVFALTHAAKLSHAEWLVWMDADVEITASPDWTTALPDGADLSFLGRPQYAYTECGFVGYRLAALAVRRMLGDMRLYYTSGEIFKRPKDDWHDSRCFDICREQSGIPRERQHSLAPSLPVTHVWPHTVLGKWSTHHKGPGRKQRAYGSIAR